ncbi:MAG: amidohydrolase [Chloroflexota bacterium]|nr:amidohydrolase [Chloroflexota bacterium]
MYKGTKVLDVHGHVTAPPAGQGYLTVMLASNTATPSPLSSGGPGRPGMTDEDFRNSALTHVKYMDDRNIDVQIIGPRPFMMLGWMEDHLLPHWTRYVNDTIFKQCQAFPDRFAGACQLPQISEAADLSNCIPELERCVKEYGFIAAYASPDPAGRRTTPGMHEPYWFPLYEACQKMGVPIIVHGTNALDRRFRVVPHNYQLGFYTEQYLATQFLSHGDVFERYPELKVVVCHCGGGLNRFIPTDTHLAQKDLSKNLFFDTCGYDVHFLEAAIKQRGVSQMCFGTEAPGSGRAVRPETGKTSDDLIPVISAFEFLSEDEKVRIFNRNPAKVFPKLAKI